MLAKEPKLHIALIVSVLLAVTMLMLFTLQRTGMLNGGVTNGPACTEEAKLCPDGSAVGRTGPNCEFAACPTPQVRQTIIYDQDPEFRDKSWTQEQKEAHCKVEGGDFHPCESACADNEPCITVCVEECRFSINK